jgi:hypothetical protein
MKKGFEFVRDVVIGAWALFITTFAYLHLLEYLGI